MIRSLFVTIFLFLSLTANIFALEPWEKSSSNPLLYSGSYEEWTENWQLQPSVMIEDGRYKMWYTSSNGDEFKVAYAESDDGLSWERKKLTNLIDDRDTHDPSVMKKDGQYLLVFASSKKGKDYRIHLAESTNEVDFTKETVREILVPKETWETRGISAPFLYFEGEIYHLFYSAWDQTGWKVALATSSDGVTWERCTTNPIIAYGDGPSLIKYGGISYLFIHMPDPSGIKYFSSTGELSCNTFWKKEGFAIQTDKSYDSRHVTSPSPLLMDQGIYLYYSGLSQDVNWHINLATSLSQKKSKLIVVVPGFLASWNRDAVLHNTEVPYQEWKMLPFVREYDGLIETFRNLGKIEGKDFVVFPYDWSKKIESTASDLNSFLENNYLNNDSQLKVDVVGHSLGGLVGRVWAQKYGQDSLDKLVTIGSPHQGVVQAYKPLEAGEIDRQNNLLWLMEKLVLVLNKSGFQTDREVISNRLPVLYDLFPTFDFLKNESGFISIGSLTIQNDLLKTYNQSLSSFVPNLTAIGGIERNTPSGFVLGERTFLDKLMNFYPDGRPAESLFNSGDSTVLRHSSLIGNNSLTFPQSHGEIVYKKDSIKEILNRLGISYEESQIIEGSATQISPSLMFLLKSPATLEVISPDKAVYKESDGIIFIANAPSGNYQINVYGTEKGNYTLITGEITEQVDSWNTIIGKISQDPPTTQLDTYLLNFDKIKPKVFSTNINDPTLLFDMIIKELSILNENIKSKDMVDAVDDMKRARIHFMEKNSSGVKKELLKTMQEVFDVRRKSNYSLKISLYETIKKVEILYTISFEQNFSQKDLNELRKKLAQSEKKSYSLEQTLLKKKLKGANVLTKSVILKLLEEKVRNIKTSVYEDPQYAVIQLQTARMLLDEYD